ncbi:MAG: hypothetical protein ACTHMY_23040 [Solirubrobacteraceae bacterium]
MPSTSAFTSSLPSASGSLAAAVASLPAPTGGESTLAGIAEHLGMSTEDLQSALKGGESLAALAEQHGVSRESIGTFIGSQMQRARMYSGQLPLDDDVLARTVDRALDRGRRPDADTPAPAPQTYEAVATATYASNARPLPVDVSPAGGTISLLV